MREACPAGEGPYACPCCKLLTLDARCAWEICPECGWEDDGGRGSWFEACLSHRASRRPPER
ncbi:CPCC family cysteine-rich protein [Streptomyces niveus]|uniref:CPCC family cysteine-rich protein n=1 Tax=Streptomyces niveus TaxID=193462 RepID=UPI00368F63B0